MDFSKAGFTEPAGAGFRALVQWNDKGAKQHIYGPKREDQQAAHEDLEHVHRSQRHEPWRRLRRPWGPGALPICLVCTYV